MANKEMMSLRIDPARRKDLEYLSSIFECSKVEIIENLISYAVQQVECTKDIHSPFDVVKVLAFDSFGYDWEEKIKDLYQED